jgi:AI-2 transport protein TqsA
MDDKPEELRTEEPSPAPPAPEPAAAFPSVVVGAAVIVAGMGIGGMLYVMRPVLVPLVLALLTAYLLSPLVDVVQVRLKTPRPLAVLAAFLVTGLLFALLGSLLSSSVRSLADKWPMYEQKVVGMADSVMLSLEDWGLPVDTEILAGKLKELPIADALVGTLDSLLSSASNIILVLIFVIYLVAGRTPHAHKSGIYKEIDARVNRYILVKVIASAVTGLLTGLILAALGLDLAVVFGLLAFLLNFIPSIGSVIAMLLPLPVALVQFDSGVMITLAVALPGAVQFVVGNVIEPRFMGTALELHPITILLSLIFWGMLWGGVGMLLAAPITAVIKIILDRIPTTRPLADLLGGKLPESGESMDEGFT